jgi:transposase-like protein
VNALLSLILYTFVHIRLDTPIKRYLEQDEEEGVKREMPGRAWTEEKLRIVLESLNTNITLAKLWRKYAVSPTVFYHWKKKFIEGGRLALSGALKDPIKGICLAVRFQKSFQEADRGMADAFVDYNRNRPHSALGYKSPYEFMSSRLKVVVN